MLKSKGENENEQSIQLWLGDCLKRMQELEESSIGAVVSDPPYELNFMGRGWDDTGIAFRVDLWLEVYRVLRPGGVIKVVGGSRTFHRMVRSIEDAGFVQDDLEAWNYGSGFPKSMNISKAIDKMQGAEREVVGTRRVSRDLTRNGQTGDMAISNGPVQGADVEVTTSATEEAKKWEGWGTALKPAFEPIVVARKPEKVNTNEALELLRNLLSSKDSRRKWARVCGLIRSNWENAGKLMGDYLTQTISCRLDLVEIDDEHACLVGLFTEGHDPTGFVSYRADRDRAQALLTQISDATGIPAAPGE